MVDNVNPNTQFHPYQPPDATPHSQRSTSGLGGILEKVGLGRGTLGNANMSDSVNKARDYARLNPGKVLGGLAAIVIGAGMMRQRSMRNRTV